MKRLSAGTLWAGNFMKRAASGRTIGGESDGDARYGINDKGKKDNGYGGEICFPAVMCLLDGREFKVIGECNICSKTLNSWDRRISRVLAYKIPVCEACIVAEYGMGKEELRARMERFFDMRPCQGV